MMSEWSLAKDKTIGVCLEIHKKKGLIVSLQRDIHTRDKTIREMYDGS